MVLPLRKTSTLLLLLSVGLYSACLPFNSFCVYGECSSWPSWGVLLFGILGFIGWTTSPANITWVANPILFAAWAFIGRKARPLALLLSLTALAIAASFMLGSTVVTNEGGGAAPITGYAIGYWLWLASMVAACLAALSICAPSRR